MSDSPNIYILNIETATTVCSVSLSLNGLLLNYKELDAGFTHAENLHLFILEILGEAGVSVKELSAIAVSKGPGSYTGLRIGVSAAKGLAYALNLPLISIDTLQVMSNMAFAKIKANGFYCPMIDARRMEVYSAVYNHELKAETETEALIVDENSIQKLAIYSKLYFFGDGAAKCADLMNTLPNTEFIENIFPSARFMCDLSFEKFDKKQFEDLAYFEPFYLKDFLILSKKADQLP